MSLEKLEALIQTSPYPWWEWEPKTDRLVFSPFKVTKLGYPMTRFLGKGYGAFMALVHPDDADRAMASMRRLLYEGADLYQIDYRIRDASGVYHWFMDRGFVTARDEAGKPQTIRGIVIDLGREGLEACGPENAHSIISESLRVSDSNAKSFITICASCKRVKARDGTYVPITEDLFSLLSEEISHSVCPQCMEKLYPEMSQLRGRTFTAPAPAGPPTPLDD